LISPGRIPRRAWRRCLLSVGLVWTIACGGERAQTDVAGAPETPETGAEDGPREFFERHLVFVSSRSDSTLMVPLSFRAAANDQNVAREVRAWLDRSGEWEPFFMDVWRTAPSRSPWRILPRGPLRLIVGPQDALERVVFEEGPRRLELSPGTSLSEWAGPGGEAIRVQEGSLVLSDRRVDGWILDIARGWREPSAPPGDLAFLASGDSLQMVLQGQTEEGDLEGETLWRAWARIEFRDQLWDRVIVKWTGALTYEPARRQIPDGWSLSTADTTLVGTLDVRSSDLATGAGDGPMLPVEAVFEVTGTIRVEGRDFPVHGVIRHAQRF